jgi:hypothetical protein
MANHGHAERRLASEIFWGFIGELEMCSGFREKAAFQRHSHECRSGVWQKSAE